MKRIPVGLWTRRLGAACGIAALTSSPAQAQQAHQVASPDGRTVVTVEVLESTPQHTPGLFYRVERDGAPLFLPSRLGFEFIAAQPLAEDLAITGSVRSSQDETWEQPWGEVRTVRDHHNELTVDVEETHQGTVMEMPSSDSPCFSTWVMFM